MDQLSQSFSTLNLEDIEIYVLYKYKKAAEPHITDNHLITQRYLYSSRYRYVQYRYIIHPGLLVIAPNESHPCRRYRYLYVRKNRGHLITTQIEVVSMVSYCISRSSN
jgi:hypothetical protein